MRIGSYNTTVRYRNSINRTYEDQTKLIELSDGSKLHRPSDDCVNYSKYLRHSVTYSENNQYQTNVQTAISWMKNTDAALVDMTSAFSKIVVKSNQADGSNSDADMRAIAGEMLVQAQQAVADANTNVNGRYLFSGQADLVQPYEISKEKYERGIAKTLDDKQAAFFSDATKSSDVVQMLTLEGSDGSTYYLNTQTGNVYTKDFVEEGYKEKIAQGQTYVKDADRASVLADGSSFMVSSFFQNTGVRRTDAVVTEEGVEKTMNFGATIAGKTTYDASGTPVWGKSVYADTDLVVFDANGYNRTIPAGTKTAQLWDGETAYVGGKADGNDPDSLTGVVYDKNKNWYKFSTVSQNIVTYSGDRKQFSMVKENGSVQPSSDTVNASGLEIAGRGIFDNADSGNEVSAANAFNDMFTVYAMCEHGRTTENGKGKAGPDSSWMNSDGKTLANAAYNTVNSAQTKIASRQSVYRDCQAMLTTQNQQILGDITDVHSTDVAKLAVDMMKSQTVYNLSLNVGARILPQTLTDYLR